MDAMNYLDDFRKTFKSPHTLYPHQEYAIGFLEYLRRRGVNFSGLFMEMGTGKTKTIISWFDYLYKIEQVESILILCPLTVITTWVDEFKIHAPHLFKFVKIAIGSKEERLNIFNEKQIEIPVSEDENLINEYPEKDQYPRIKTRKAPKIVITNYETIRVLFKKKDTKSLNTAVKWVPEMMILDESTRIKNLKALLTQICLIMSPMIDYKYLLSGKPITRNPFDIYAQMRFLHKNILEGRSYTSFKKKVAITQWTGTYEKVLLWRNLDWLKEKIEDIAVVLDKKSAGIKLPEKVYSKRRGYLTEDQYKAYKLVAKKNLLWVEEQGEHLLLNNLLTKMTKLMQITSGFAYYDDGTKTTKYENSAKIMILKDIIDEIDDDEQIIIWCLFKEELYNICALLNDLNIVYEKIHGGISDEERKDSLNHFKNGNSRVLVAQVASACYGLNLNNARYAIYFTNTFNFEHRIQSEDRIHRIGQEKTCYYIDIVISDTIDEMIIANHMIKKDLMNNSLPDPAKIDQVKEGLISEIKDHLEEVTNE